MKTLSINKLNNTKKAKTLCKSFNKIDKRKDQCEKADYIIKRGRRLELPQCYGGNIDYIEFKCKNEFVKRNCLHRESTYLPTPTTCSKTCHRLQSKNLSENIGHVVRKSVF